MKSLIILSVFLIIPFVICDEIINLQDIEIPDVDDFEAIKEKCDRLGGAGTYDKLKASKEVVQGCLQGFVDFTQLKDEVEAAKKTGSMDEVFGKYCAKRSKVETCVKNFTSTLKSCLESEEKRALATTLDILKQLGEFVCFRDGDRIAMFVAEGGVECIKSHTEGIKTCVNTTFKITPAINTSSLPNLLIDKKKCDDLGKLQTCVVEELEHCKDSTPANIVDALFRFIKKAACNSAKTTRSLHSIVRRSVDFASTLYNQTAVTNRFYVVMKERCAQNAADRGYENLMSSVEAAHLCLTTKGKRDRIFVATAEQLKEDIQECTEDLIKKAEACLSSEEKYFPQFYANLLKTLVDFLYTNKNKLFGTSLRSELIHCMQTYKTDENAKKRLTQCLKKCDQPDNNNLQKETYCRLWGELKTCVTKELNSVCIRDVEINKLKDELFNNVFLKPCNE